MKKQRSLITSSSGIFQHLLEGFESFREKSPSPLLSIPLNHPLFLRVSVRGSAEFLPCVEDFRQIFFKHFQRYGEWIHHPRLVLTRYDHMWDIRLSFYDGTKVFYASRKTRHMQETFSELIIDMATSYRHYRRKVQRRWRRNITNPQET